VAHSRATALSKQLAVPTITTAWVVTELADALSAQAQRGIFLSLLESLRGNPEVTILPPTAETFGLGLELYAKRPDKDWSLTDCISFVVMKQRGISEALTGDRHFERAGFRALLI
jgi:predicted nucleic acid-binding protein